MEERLELALSWNRLVSELEIGVEQTERESTDRWPEQQKFWTPESSGRMANGLKIPPSAPAGVE